MAPVCCSGTVMSLCGARTRWSVWCLWCVLCVSGCQGGLYTVSDEVSVLNAETMASVLKSSSAALVEFYATWCGHCAAFSPVWRSLAADTREWKPAVDVAAIDCADEENRMVCTDYGIRGYPSLKFFPAFSEKGFTGEYLKGFPRNVRGLRHLMIDKLEAHKDKWPPACPPLEPLSTAELSNYTQNSNMSHLALLFESEDSYVGREVILDMLQYENISVRRVLSSEEELVSRLGVKTFPSCYLYHSHTNHTRLDVLDEARAFYSYALRRLPGVVRSGKALPAIRDPAKNVTEEEWRPFNLTRVYMSDLESALHYSLRVELSAHSVISGDDLTALKQYISVLAKYFPGRPAVTGVLKAVDNWLQQQEGTSLTYSDFRAVLDNTVLNSEAVLPTGVRWVGCQGSRAQYRGYPCAVWTLFHVLTVQAEAQNSSDPQQVLQAMRAYISSFFGCRSCATHFESMAQQVSLAVVSSLSEAVLWLWVRHNQVNSRLAGALSEDPVFPKVQWPPPDLCPNCHSLSSEGEHVWRVEDVLPFLQGYFGAQHILLDYLPDESETIKHQRAQILATAARRKARELQETPPPPPLEDQDEEEETDEAVTDPEEEEVEVGDGAAQPERPQVARKPTIVGLRLREAQEDIVDLDSFVNQHYRSKAGRSPLSRDKGQRVKRELVAQQERDSRVDGGDSVPQGQRWVSLLSVGFSRLDVSLCVLLYLLSSVCLLTMYLIVTVRRRLRRDKLTLLP